MNYPKSSALEKELTASVKQSASGGARAMTATIIAACDPATADAADALVDTLMGRRPVRVVHLRTRSGTEAFHSWSAARCSLDKQNRGVCFEDVYIESSDDQAADPRAWGSLVMRELPALMLWRIPLGGCPECMGDWEERIDLVVFDGSAEDSSKRDTPGAFASAVKLAFASAPALADLAWSRLENARVAVSRLFDAPSPAGLAKRVVSLEVAAADPWSAALLAGWIASRIQWLVSSSGGKFRWLNAAGTEIRLELASGAETSVRFGFDDGSSAEAAFKDRRDATLSFPDGSELEMFFTVPEDGAVLARLIDAPLADPLYREALEVLSHR